MIYVLSVLVGLFGILKLFSYKKSCEDDYQHSKRLQFNEKPIIVSAIQFNEEKEFRNLVNIICNNSCEYNKEYNKWYKKKIKSINLFTDKDSYINCKDYSYKIYLDFDNRKFHGSVDHEFIGGANIAKTTFCPIERKQKNYFLNSSGFDILFLILLWFRKSTIPKVENPLPLVEKREDITRFTRSYYFNRNEINSSIKSHIIYNILYDLNKCLGLKRDLVCYLPIAFNNVKNIYNNIGVIWLTYNETMNVKDIEKQIKNNAYQSYATNFAIRHKIGNSKTGKTKRKQVDAVITIIFSYSDVNFPFLWTVGNVMDYPVYVSVSSQLNDNIINVNQTFTVSTDVFNIDKSENKYTSLHRDYFIF
jgi:hypothetical protein